MLEYIIIHLHVERVVSMSASKPLLGGYSGEIRDKKGKERYREKLQLIGGQDPYELPRNEWKDDVDLWPEITYVDVGMYLLFAPSPYTREELRNYKSMQSYQRFIAGWVREILVKDVADKRVVISKVRLQICHFLPNVCRGVSLLLG